jgi:cytochrome c oxidase subunit IV
MFLIVAGKHMNWTELKVLYRIVRSPLKLVSLISLIKY